MKVKYALATLLTCLSINVHAAESPPYILMQDDLAELKADFNDAVDRVRLMFIVGPT